MDKRKFRANILQFETTEIKLDYHSDMASTDSTLNAADGESLAQTALTIIGKYAHLCRHYFLPIKNKHGKN